MKRTPLRRRSAKAIAAAATHAAVREIVFGRDTRCVLWGYEWTPPCSGHPLTPHHLVKAGQGGSYDTTNLITLCAGHNTWVEDFPLDAHAIGLVVRRGETHAEAAERRRLAGIPAGLFGLGADWGDR